MAAKPEAKEAPAAPAPEKSATTPPVEAPKKSALAGLKAWLPVALAVLAAPAACWAVAEYVLLPRMEKKLTAVVALGPEAAAEHLAAATPPAKEKGGEKKKGGHGGKEEGVGGGGDTYEFTNVVVNLSGTMGTRYLKTSFVVTGAKPDTIKAAFEENKAKLMDVTLGVLSSLSLADLEEPGAKNVLREKLVTAYNQALGGTVAEQVYFSDFVVQ